MITDEQFIDADIDNIDKDAPIEVIIGDVGINSEIDVPVVEITVDDHRKLRHRDAEKQHPISAIEQLEETLESLEDSGIGTIYIDELFKLS